MFKGWQKAQGTKDVLEEFKKIKEEEEESTGLGRWLTNIDYPIMPTVNPVYVLACFPQEKISEMSPDKKK